MTDGAEVHIIPQMGADRYWFEQYEAGKITHEEWLKTFLDNTSPPSPSLLNPAKPVIKTP